MKKINDSERWFPFFKWGPSILFQISELIVGAKHSAIKIMIEG